VAEMLGSAGGYGGTWLLGLGGRGRRYYQEREQRNKEHAAVAFGEVWHRARARMAG
jgi:hypothetical protein